MTQIAAPKTIELNIKGHIVLIDESDLALISKHKWHILAGRTAGLLYAVTTVYRPKKTVYMHRLILGNPIKTVDHVNGNGLDNRRSNLRLATLAQQNQNKRGKSQYKGVIWHSGNQKWMAHIKTDKRICKYFDSETEAAKGYNALALEYFGEYAKLNVLEESCQ